MKKVVLVITSLIFGFACFGISDSPTMVFKGFLTAAKKKDGAAMKKYLSKDSLALITAAAKGLNKTDDEYLASIGDAMDETPELKDEKIAGDGQSATLEMKGKSGAWTTIDFSREDGWKLEMDKSKAKKNDPAKADAADSSSSDSSSSTSSSTKTSGDSGPLNVTVSELLEMARAADADDKLNNRLITVTGGDLWDIQSGQIQVGEKYSSSNYINCMGSFSDYMAYSSKVSEMRKAGKAITATIKGQFKSVSTGYSNNYVVLDPCVLSDLQK